MRPFIDHLTSARRASVPSVDQPGAPEDFPPVFPGGWRLGAEEESAVVEAIRRKRLFRYYGATEGKSCVEEFEEAFAARLGRRHALAVNSGSSALVCALIGAGVGPGDEVIIPAYSFVAVAGAVLVAGAVPVVADVDDSLNLDPADVAARMTADTRAVLAVHMRGAAADVPALLRTAAPRRVQVIEDVAQSCGGGLDGRPLGSLSGSAAFSLQYNKIITAGEGGVMVTDDEEAYQRALMFHDVNAGGRHKIADERVMLGLNLRMSELTGAVALAQLAKLDGILADLRRVKTTLLAEIGPSLERAGATRRRLLDPTGDAATNIIVFFPTPDAADRIRGALRANGIPVTPLYQPEKPDPHVYTSWPTLRTKKSWGANGPWQWHRGDVDSREAPRTLERLRRGLSLAISPDFTDQHIDRIARAFDKACLTLAP
jgi:dTDP-4-amino-4,6-dideoxygalactose transaminase